MNIFNPASGEIIKTIVEDSAADIKRKYQTSRSAQAEWAARSIADRIDCIRKFSELLAQNMNELASILTSEVGKPFNQSKGEIKGAMARIRFFLLNSEKWLAEEPISDENGTEEKITYEALGVIANISAWNYPYLVGVNVFVPALIAGNAVLYKPSEFSTLTGLKIGDMFNKAGVPDEIFQVVVGERSAGEALLDLPLDGYFFTGSHRTGQYIYQKVASKMVPCQLELGGKDPMYVTEDNADIKKAASVAAEGAFYNNGQSCCAVERIYVHQNIYNEFVSAFLEEVQTYQVGDPNEEGVFIGPLTRKAQLKVLSDQVADALKKGGNLLMGGHSIDGVGYYFQPTVFTNTNHDMKLMMEESFGPLIGIQKVADDAEAIQLMMDTPYGLTASVLTESKSRATAILKQMDTGTVYWNCCDRVSANLPWSGRRNSGFGTTLSHHGIRAFTQVKAWHLRR